MTASEIRDAATVILVRNAVDTPLVLMGQRGANAAFMPSKFVFPGGAVDAGDHAVARDLNMSTRCAGRLKLDADPVLADALPVTAVRELWEETGLALSDGEGWPHPPADWSGFSRHAGRPSVRSLSFVFRAITPPGRPRRFDARFFLADAGSVFADPDDFSLASDELSALSWVPISEARKLDLPFITQVVLAEVAARLPDLGPPPSVPFFRNDDEESLFQCLGSSAP